LQKWDSTEMTNDISAAIPPVAIILPNAADEEQGEDNGGEDSDGN
jgi:hypothetical protein